MYIYTYIYVYIYLYIYIIRLCKLQYCKVVNKYIKHYLPFIMHPQLAIDHLTVESNDLKESPEKQSRGWKKRLQGSCSGDKWCK